MKCEHCKVVDAAKNRNDFCGTQDSVGNEN